jgi:hypothetical protein
MEIFVDGTQHLGARLQASALPHGLYEKTMGQAVTAKALANAIMKEFQKGYRNGR